MADTNIHANREPLQPELRAYVSFDRLPPNCIAFVVQNEESFPHLRPGEIAIVDTEQRDPVRNELFLVEYGRSSRPCRCVAELWTRQHRNSDGEFTGWWSGAYARRREAVFGRRIACDGPLLEQDMKDVVLGRVVGILESIIEEPKRLAA